VIFILRNPIERLLAHFDNEEYSLDDSLDDDSLENRILEEVAELRNLGLSKAPLLNEVHLHGDKEQFYIPHFPDLMAKVLKAEVPDSVRLMLGGMYSLLLQTWFLRGYELGNNLLLIQYERFRKEPRQVLDEISDFLGLSRASWLSSALDTLRDDDPDYDSLADASTATIIYLRKFFRPHNIRLAQMLGEDWPLEWNAGTSKRYRKGYM
jgi:hypothetical protein